MKHITALAVAFALSSACAFAAESVTVEKSSSTGTGDVQKSTTVQSSTESPAASVKTETTKESSTAVSPGSVTKTSSSSSSSYTTRIEGAYRAAGVADTDIVKLRDIDLQILEARKANNDAKVKEYYTQQTRILKPEQVTKVRTYLTEHPVAVSEPKYYVSSYETYPATAGVSINTPMGGASIGVPAGGTVVEKKEVVPANP